MQVKYQLCTKCVHINQRGRIMKKLFTTILPVLLLVLGPAEWAAADLELVTGKH